MNTFSRNSALALGAVILAFGAIGPWITFLGVINGGPANLLEVGLVVFGGIGLVALSALTGRYMRPVSILVGVGILIEAGYVWFVLSEAQSSEVGGLVSPGWGLYLSILASLYLIASTWIAKKRV